jgi:hypothetical protein
MAEIHSNALLVLTEKEKAIKLLLLTIDNCSRFSLDEPLRRLDGR